MRRNWQNVLVNILHIPTTSILIIIAMFFITIIFTVFFETIYRYYLGDVSVDFVLESVFIVFICIELVAAIKIYFRQNYHFPLRFFIYIGITDLIRRIIIVSQDANIILLYSLGLFVLVAALGLLEVKNYYLKTKYMENGEDHFEL